MKFETGVPGEGFNSERTERPLVHMSDGTGRGRTRLGSQDESDPRGTFGSAHGYVVDLSPGGRLLYYSSLAWEWAPSAK